MKKLLISTLMILLTNNLFCLPERREITEAKKVESNKGNMHDPCQKTGCWIGKCCPDGSCQLFGC